MKGAGQASGHCYVTCIYIYVYVYIYMYVYIRRWANLWPGLLYPRTFWGCFLCCSFLVFPFVLFPSFSIYSFMPFHFVTISSFNFLFDAFQVFLSGAFVQFENCGLDVNISLSIYIYI